MPFTFSHPAIILPLAKMKNKYISITALVAGSMAPDFEYFINMKMKQIHGHTIEGVFYYNLPLTILLCFLFHSVARDALITYSPLPLKSELKAYYQYNWMERFKSKWYIILISALVGIFSHLFWDSLTHADRFLVNKIPFLQQTTYWEGYSMPNHDIFWLVSSVVGLIIVVLSVVDIKFSQNWKNEKRPKLIYWTIVTFITLIVLILRGVASMNVFIATLISGGLIGLLLAPMLMKLLKLEGKIFNTKPD